MATINSYSGLTSEQKTFYDRALLERLLPATIFVQHGQKRPIPKNEGDKVNFRRYQSLAVPAASLTEGVTPEGVSLSISKIDASVKEEGNYVTMTEKLDLMGIDKNIAEASSLMGENAAETLETRCADVIFAGTTQQYVGGVSAAAATGALTCAEIRKAVKTLKEANARRHADGFYHAFIDPEGAENLQADKEWQECNVHNGTKNIERGYIGEYGGVKFYESTLCPLDENQAHRCLIFGADSYGCTSIEGESQPRVIVKPAGSAGTADPLDQRSTVGWKAWFVAARLNEEAMCCIYFGKAA